MILYAESSAVAAWLLLEERAPAIRATLSGAEAVLASDLTLLESDRALRRAVELGRISEAEAMTRRGALSRAAAGWSWMRLAPAILERARAAFPLEPVRSLDALHLASALAALAAVRRLTMLSIDERVRRNAKALGLAVAP
jgi:predicted nucleic acid-binding protein